MPRKDNITANCAQKLRDVKKICTHFSGHKNCNLCTQIIIFVSKKIIAETIFDKIGELVEFYNFHENTCPLSWPLSTILVSKMGKNTTLSISPIDF